MTAATSRSNQLTAMTIRLWSMISFLVFEELCGFLPAEITFKKLGFGLRQVDNDETVEHVRKLAVDTEAEQLPAELQVLTQQDGHTDVCSFHVGDCGCEVVDVEQLHCCRELGSIAEAFPRCYKSSQRRHRRIPLEE